MSDKIPQFVDVQIKFSDIKYNISPTTVDLSAVDDIVLALTTGNPKHGPTTLLKFSLVPERFTIDNTNKTVIVQLTAAEATTELGKCYVNLWIQKSGKNLTHLMQNFEVVIDVKFEAVA